MNTTHLIPAIIHGATGRMGQAVLHEIMTSTTSSRVAAALVRPGSAMVGESLSKHFGETASLLEYTDVLDPGVSAKVMIDFSSGEGFDAGLALALERKMGFLSGTTGLHVGQVNALHQAAEYIPVLWSANFSVGVALLQHLVQIAAQQLPVDFDVEILEMHHTKKRDAPSGTALQLGQIIADARNVAFADTAQYARHGAELSHQHGHIGFASLRVADVVGEHTVIFGADGERLELTHRATNRTIFARGAVRAAIWLANQAPGYYELRQIFGNQKF